MTVRALVIAGGPAPRGDIAGSLPAADLVIAADSGADHARALGLRPNLIVGDLDSIGADTHHWAQAEGIAIQEHPANKDETDLELALSFAAARADEVVVVDSGSGRLDHALANLFLLASDRFAGVGMRAFTKDGLVTVIRTTATLSGAVGDLVSLLAVGGAARGVTTDGLRWPLVDALLEPGSTWGVSNEFVAAAPSVSITGGVLLAIQPVRPA